MQKKRKKHTFKKIILLLIIIMFAYVLFNKLFMMDVLSIVNKEKGEISSYYIYGTHFNLSGSIELKSLDSDSKFNLVLKSSFSEIIIDSDIKEENDMIRFNISDKINNGFNLNSLKREKYYLLLKETNKNDVNYYSFKCDLNLEPLNYYTIDKNNNNNKISVVYDSKNEALFFDSKKVSSNDRFYDITIDAGHGNVDTGTSYKLKGKTYYESDLTLKVSKSLKNKLEKMGYKVLLTRSSNKDLDYYGKYGRAFLPNKYHTKLTLSIHLNSENDVMNYGGVEIYTPNDIDYTFASNLASNIVKYTNTTYSKKKLDKIKSGVYYSYFDLNDIKKTTLESINNKLAPYDISEGAPEMYMIREVGGFMTKAYVDGRNEKIGLNPFYDSHIASESYLIELGYISYLKDLKNIINNYDSYAKAISISVDDYLMD